MSDVPLIVAGILALLGAAVHGAGGEVLVVRRLAIETLEPSRFGGPRMTKAMIHATWHVTTAAFFAVGCGLVLAGSALDGDLARGVGVLAAAAATGFAAVVVGIGAAYMRAPGSMLRHPGPVVLTATAALAWWGVL